MAGDSRPYMRKQAARCEICALRDLYTDCTITRRHSAVELCQGTNFKTYQIQPTTCTAASLHPRYKKQSSPQALKVHSRPQIVQLRLALRDLQPPEDIQLLPSVAGGSSNISQTN
jgi:hypothetical protein